jgi:hypothetical protein
MQTMPNLTKGKCDKNFLTKVKQEVKVLANIPFILEKIESEGFLKILRDSYHLIINNEILFALNELSKLEKKSKGIDLRNQLTNNTYIFKENLKAISGFVSELISRSVMEREDQKRRDQRNDRIRSTKLEKRCLRGDQRRRGELYFVH